MDRKHNNTLFFGFALVVAFSFFIRSLEQTQTLEQIATIVESTDNAQALSGMTYTIYHPIASDTGNKTIEGGSNDRFGRPIVTATDILAARARGESNAGGIDRPITLAGAISHTNEIYLIPKLTFTTINPDGTTQQHTITNVFGKVTDTGSAFTKRPDKIDIATDHAASQAIANRQDRLPNNTATVELIPANDKARQFAREQGTHRTSLDKSAKDSIQQFTTDQFESNTGSNPTGNVPGGTLWMTTPLCFKHMGPAGPGRVSKATSCNSGFTTPPGSPPVPIPDCGIGGVLCTIPTGCLNLNCAANNNAIFDPVTKTCGCG